METECYRIIRDLTRQTDLVKKNAQSDAKTQDAGLTSDLAFICGEKRQPLTKESFGNCFREACRKAGIDKSAHGVRKISATRAANAGATVAQLQAIFGWTDDDMPSLYTRSADRRRLAMDAIGKLERNKK